MSKSLAGKFVAEYPPPYYSHSVQAPSGKIPYKIYTVLILMECMIQFNVRNKLFVDSHNVYIYMERFDDLYQKIARFSEIEIILSSYVLLDLVRLYLFKAATSYIHVI